MLFQFTLVCDHCQEASIPVLARYSEIENDGYSFPLIEIKNEDKLHEAGWRSAINLYQDDETEWFCPECAREMWVGQEE